MSDGSMDGAIIVPNDPPLLAQRTKDARLTNKCRLGNEDICNKPAAGNPAKEGGSSLTRWDTRRPTLAKSKCVMTLRILIMVRASRLTNRAPFAQECRASSDDFIILFVEIGHRGVPAHFAVATIARRIESATLR